MNKRFQLVGDTIGLTAAVEDAFIHLMDRTTGISRYVSLAEALSLADEIDEYGLMRIVSCLSHAADHGDLSAADLATWRKGASE